MAASALERVLRRDRAVVAAALALIALLAWAYVARLAAHMHMAGGADAMADMAVPGMSMPGTMAPDLRPWSAADALFAFAMWAVMMTAMMTPAVAPMVLVHARVARQAEARGKAFAATGWFAAGYLLAWTAFAAAATVAQWGLERAALLTPMMAAASDLLGGAVLVAVGLYQWTPVKDACLAQCRSPLLFIQRHGGFRPDAAGALALGTRHGLYCIGCCWALMLLLFVGGVMNLLWIAALAGFVLAEKVLPAGRMLARAAGAGLVAAGVWLIAAGLS